MSRDAEEGRLPGRPGRPRPESKRPAGARPGGGPGDEGSSTWQPNPRRAKPAQARLKTSGPAVEPEVVAEPRGPGWWERIFFGRVGSGQLALYCRQFASYSDAGVDLLKALSSLERQFAKTALGPVTGRLLQAVRRGDTLSEAMEREPQAFDSLFLSMIKVAEARGGVPETLRMLSRHYEARQSLIRQARSAMIYPIAVLLVASAVVTMLTLWLLPMFISLLNEVAGRGATLPLPSRVLMGFSRFIQTLGWWLVPLVAVAAPLIAFRIYRTAAGKRVIDELALYVPVLGSLLSKLDTARFARALSTLMGAGVDVGTSLDLTAGVMQLEPFRRAIRDARVQVLDGSELSVALGVSRRFSTD